MYSCGSPSRATANPACGSSGTGTELRPQPIIFILEDAGDEEQYDSKRSSRGSGTAHAQCCSVDDIVCNYYWHVVSYLDAMQSYSTAAATMSYATMQCLQ